jgi:hypothetical protein
VTRSAGLQNCNILSSFSEPVAASSRISTELPDPDLVPRKRQITKCTFHISKRPLWSCLQVAGETWHPHVTGTTQQNGIWIYVPKADNCWLRNRVFTRFHALVVTGTLLKQTVIFPPLSSELIRDTSLENQQSTVGEHSVATKHSIDCDRTEIIANICSYHPHIIREPTEITKYPFNVKHIDSYTLSKAWRHLFSPKSPSVLLRRTDLVLILRWKSVMP